MGYASFISVGSINYTASGNNTPTPPSHQANDILIISCLNDAGTTSTSTTGWTEIAEVKPGTPSIAWYWKRATASGTAGDLFVASKTADPGWTAGNLATVKLSRDVSEDDAAADISVLMIEIEWEVS